MPNWKKNIFVNAIIVRMVQESRTADDIIKDYPVLTDEENIEIMAAINAV